MVQKRNVNIDYTALDFNSIRERIVEYAKRYYPNTYQDFSENAFNSFFTDIVAYVGDQLSFYLDYAANESFIPSALEIDNIIKLSRSYGYKFRGNSSSQGDLELFILVPANSTGLGPNTNYLPRLKRGSEFNSSSGVTFMLLEDVDFANASNQIAVGAVDANTGLPTSYAVRTIGSVVSGKIARETKVIGSFERFRKLQLLNQNITNIISVIDTEGHEYFEVDYLSQNVIYKALANTGDNSDQAPFILKPHIVPRRFVFERNRNEATLQFGSGTDLNQQANTIADPSDVVFNLHGRDYISSEMVDPTVLINSDKMGISPANTTLVIVYRVNESDNVNVTTNSITQSARPIFRFTDRGSLNSVLVNGVINSLEVTNPEAISGDVRIPTADELKQRIYGFFSSQARAVTREDYKAMTYRMPAEFGSIKRVNVLQDADSFRRNLNLYVISETLDGTLGTSATVIKENLKTWLGRQKMVNDTVDILDAKIVNFGVRYTAVARDGVNKFDILNSINRELRDRFSRYYDIGEPISVGEIYSIINGIDDVVDTVEVKIEKKEGTLYSSNRFSFDLNSSPDGRNVYAPENVIFEIKFLNSDIQGTIK